LFVVHAYFSVYRLGQGPYHEDEDYYICPNGRKLTYRGIRKERTSSGYVAAKETYMCESCKYCRKKKLCKRGKGNRQIEWNEKWQRLKAKTRKALEKHEELRKQRSVEVETVFGQRKGNQGYRRFLLRGRAKVSAEWGLFSLGYDIKQLYRINRLK
jgi:ABC-2 type transport system ATP-binding protein/transposase